MSRQRSEVVEWVAGHVLPHERELRGRLRGQGASVQEIDDIVQEAYLQIARLTGVGHIRDGRAYLFAAARMVVLQRVRRERIVRIDQLSDGDALAVADEAPDPERRAQARQELERVTALIRGLPPRCRQVFELRRVEGVSQRVIAERLGIPEHTVEQEATRGLKLLLSALTRSGEERRPARRGALDRLRRRRP